MKNQSKNAIQLLIADHEKVKALFEEYEGLSDRAKVSKKRIADKICQELMIHTQVEEKVFYPAVCGPIQDDELMNEAVVEHASAKDLIAQIMEMNPEDELYDAKVKVLSEQIDHHVKEEEKDMFPQVRKTQIDLLALGEKMQAYRAELTSEITSEV